LLWQHVFACAYAFSHKLAVLQLSTGIGKRKVDIQDSDSKAVADAKLKEHALLGLRILESMDSAESVPNEVKLIVSQHHELHDGTGYPKKLRGSNIYDLARIVSIANIFDQLVSEGKGSLSDRQKVAVATLDQKYFNKIEPDKHEKAVKILLLGV
jgi:HD-GYP domain-containing protein (c-di-GMP phosphodiesterase class II)